MLISTIKLNENFFSEKIEVVLITTLNNNTSILEFQVTGNRLSHPCLKK